ncbi:MAG: T9SS type A sorting domain-containing protein, partial [Hymenobacter sp.]
ADFDPKYDAYKLPNSSGTSLSSFFTGGELSINGLAPLTGAAVTVPLNVQVPAAGSYSLNALDLLNFDTATKVYLLDAQTGARVDLSQQAVYSFTASATAQPGRFSLYFGPATALATNPAALAAQVQLFPNPARGSFTVVVPAELGRAAVRATLFNQLGQQVAEQTIPMTAAGATAQFDVSSLALGIYTLRLKSGDNQVTKRLVVAN